VRDEKRETEALTRVAREKSSNNIATLMGLSERTVNSHINNVIGNVGVAARVKVAIQCALLGSISP
jgi:DNA-binding CsgD family transcriptional regulator